MMLKSRIIQLVVAVIVGTTIQAQSLQLQLILPAIDLGCIDDLSLLPKPNPDAVEAISSCTRTPIAVRHIDDILINQHCESSLLRIYEAKDPCGQSIRDTQEILFVYDTLDPFPDKELIVYVDLGCNPDLKTAIPNPDRFELPVCKGKIKWLGDERGRDGCYRELFRKYQVTSCRGTWTYVLIYNWIEDLEPPSIVCPEDIYLGCNPAFIPAPDPSEVKAKDNCCLKEVIWLLDVIIENPDGCEQTRIRKYQASDCCGNTSICEQKITWTSDVTPPVVIFCPQGKYLGCNFDWQNDLPPATPELVKAEDNCGDVEITAVLSDVTVFGCEFSISWVYIIKDLCGNIEQCLQTYTWTVDNTPPDITRCPPDLDLGCNPDGPGEILAAPDFRIEAADNCGIESIKKVSTSTVQNGADCTKFYHITYEVSDFCGNISTCKQRVFWREDVTPPTIICPPDLHLGCAPEEIPEPDLTQIEAYDDCGIASVDMAASSITNDFGVITITRTYTATDHCGNQSSCDQTITYNEIGIQVYVICPEDVDFGCVREMPQIPAPEPNETDNAPCALTRVHAGDDLLQTTPCEYLLTRTYLYITCCQDTITCFQSFKWRTINSDSIIAIPQDITAFCSVPSLPDFVDQGLCGPGIPIFTGQEIIGDCDDGNCVIKRHWKLKDCQSSLYISDVQTIEVKCDLTLELKSESELPKRSIELNVYPNPATEWLRLGLKRPLDVTSIIIVDNQGRIAKLIPVRTLTDKFEIKIDDLTPGIYQLVVQGAERMSERFIKM